MHDEDQMEQWIDYAEAQRLTSLGRTTLSRIVNSEQVEAARVGRAVRIAKSSLMDFMRRAAEDKSGFRG